MTDDPLSPPPGSEDDPTGATFEPVGPPGSDDLVPTTPDEVPGTDAHHVRDEPQPGEQVRDDARRRRPAGLEPMDARHAASPRSASSSSAKSAGTGASTSIGWPS